MMGRPITLEEGMSILEEGIVRAKMILDGYPSSALFTAEEYMKFYDCVYYMCIQHQSCDPSLHLSQRFTRALEESISSRVLPSLQGKNGASLLKELTSMWANYKSMAKCLGGFFLYLDRPYRTATSLCDVSFRCFRDLVCNTHYPKLQDAAIALINQDRTENPTDRSLLKCISTFFVEMGNGKDTYYYDDYERAILADTSSYYSRLASEWLALYSCVDYIKEAEWCLKKEIQRVSEYLKQSTVEKLMQVLQWQLMGQTASKLIEKQKAENQDLPAYQNPIAKKLVYSRNQLLKKLLAEKKIQWCSWMSCLLFRYLAGAIVQIQQHEPRRWNISITNVTMKTVSRKKQLRYGTLREL